VIRLASADDRKPIEIALTNDFSLITAALARMRGREPRDLSCHGCAARTALSVLTPSIAAGRCPIFVILADTDVTDPHGPESSARNENEFAQALFPLSIAAPTLIALAPNDPADLERLTQKLALAGGRVVDASSADQVAGAIREAVASCD
jgi:hypothetical protein